MKSIFVGQLPQEQQNQIEKMLRDMLLDGADGDPKKVKEYHNATLEELVQNGMDSKIVDLDYIMTFYAHEFFVDCHEDYKDIPNAVAIIDILRNSRELEVPDFQYVNQTDEQEQEQ